MLNFNYLTTRIWIWQNRHLFYPEQTRMRKIEFHGSANYLSVRGYALGRRDSILYPVQDFDLKPTEEFQVHSWKLGFSLNSSRKMLRWSIKYWDQIKRWSHGPPFYLENSKKRDLQTIESWQAPGISPRARVRHRPWFQVCQHGNESCRSNFSLRRNKQSLFLECLRSC